MEETNLFVLLQLRTIRNSANHNRGTEQGVLEKGTIETTNGTLWYTVTGYNMCTTNRPRVHGVQASVPVNMIISWSFSLSLVS